MFVIAVPLLPAFGIAALALYIGEKTGSKTVNAQKLTDWLSSISAVNTTPSVFVHTASGDDLPDYFDSYDGLGTVTFTAELQAGETYYVSVDALYNVGHAGNFTLTVS